MGLLHWEDRYSVGVAAVDHEHRELIELINRLHAEATAQRSKDAVIGFFGDLFKAISSHFALEERFMREHGYDQLVQHKNDHERLLDEIRDLMEDYEASSRFDDRLLANALDAWFSRHFETHDARLHKALGAH
ncbi:hemerythrin family protein [Bradyrhizobium arachidis]|uniref:bacteriohemerythrin n=1 Tax=Bradyrhizobium TaxID=374 RepID=UPI00188A86C6|nr:MULTISPECIES: hemerythrin family protein [Bradyrhizobium]MDN4984056.1 hemerythrin family protein [Bradyrhizobium sp. WYCCWR 13022]QOZ51771.1 hemerythrin-like metal-binding protein [Bradyrhizobium sp. CCBAU 53338]UVO38943.1 hemerythrin family protein [Bradyrhizobium arachidis]